MAAAAQQAGPLCGVSGRGRQIRLYVEAFKLRMLQFFWWGPPLYRGKYRRWPLSLFVISGNASGRTYPTPPGGVVHNQEFSLGGQHRITAVSGRASIVGSSQNGNAPVVKFITGQEPLSNFGAYQNRLQQMGIERAVEIKQAGIDRYNAR